MIGPRALILVSCLIVAACASPPASSTAPAPVATPIAAPSSPAAESFVSPRYGYAASLSDGWQTDPIGPSLWGGASLLGPDFPATDVHHDGSQGYSLFVAAADVPASTTLDQWTRTQAEITDQQSSCHGAPDVERITLDGEPADLSILDRTDCDNDHHVLGVTALHAGRGWAIVWLAPEGAADAKRLLFEEVLASFRFPA